MALPLFAFRLHFSFPQKQRSTPYLGSAWRGAFGHALKKLVCLFKEGYCDHCPLATNCAYTTIFEPRLAFNDAAAIRGVPSPYTLYPAMDGDRCYLQMTVAGVRAIGFFPFMLHALRLAGEGEVAHIPFGFESVDCYTSKGWQMIESQPIAIDAIPAAPTSSVQLTLLTPVRFKHHGHLVTPETLNLDLWLTALRRRLISLSAYWGDESEMRELCAIEPLGAWNHADLHWRELGRYSSRQRQAMKMGGVVGSVKLSAQQVAMAWPLLWLGSMLHIGKLTTMGLGRYAITPMDREEEG